MTRGDRRETAGAFDRDVTGANTDPPGRHARPATDQILEVLRDESRRAAVRAVAAADGPLDVDDLVGRVLRRASADAGDRSACDRETKTRVDLLHCHLPKLDEASVVEYDHVNGTVREGPQLAPVLDVLDRVTE